MMRKEKELQKMAKELEKRMAVAAKELNFELAAELRDRLIVIKGQLGHCRLNLKTGVSNERTINCKRCQAA